MSGGISQPHSGGSADDPDAPKSSSGPELLSLSRCASCYNQPRRGASSESSSSAGDSGPEEDWESEAESSSGSSASEKAPSEIPEKPSAASEDAAAPECGGRDGDGREEAGQSRTKCLTQRAPLVKSFSLPTTLAPRLVPLSLLPRPRTVVSTLRLQVLSQKHDNYASYVIRHHRTEREEETTEERSGGGISSLLPPQPFHQSVIMEPGSPKKIQFAVPPLQGQLDPQAAEHIRRRRPTPATLQIYRQPGTGAADQHGAGGDSQDSEGGQRKQSTFAPPAMKGKLKGSVPEEEEEEEVNPQDD